MESVFLYPKLCKIFAIKYLTIFVKYFMIDVSQS